MSCDLNQAQSCADCMTSNGGVCIVVPPASYNCCCCDGTMAQNASDWELEQLRQQIAYMNAEMMRQAAEESSRQRVQMAQDAADLHRYHMGLTEVVDVEPIESSRERKTE